MSVELNSYKFMVKLIAKDILKRQRARIIGGDVDRPSCNDWVIIYHERRIIFMVVPEFSPLLHCNSFPYKQANPRLKKQIHLQTVLPYQTLKSLQITVIVGELLIHILRKITINSEEHFSRLLRDSLTNITVKPAVECQKIGTPQNLFSS